MSAKKKNISTFQFESVQFKVLIYQKRVSNIREKMPPKRSGTPLIDDNNKRRGRPPNSVKMVTALLTTMALSNVELDLPDTPRPFEVVNTLPLSREEPKYDETLGDDLLSVKDSGTLYNSLIISRQNWLYNDQMGVFQQYWSRREDLQEKAKLELAAMAKTPEAASSGGSDLNQAKVRESTAEPVESIDTAETPVKNTESTANTPIKGTESAAGADIKEGTADPSTIVTTTPITTSITSTNATTAIINTNGTPHPESHPFSSKRKNMNKLCECALQLGPHVFDIRLFILKNDIIEKKFNEDQEAEEKLTGIKIKREEEDSDNEKEPTEKHEQTTVTNQPIQNIVQPNGQPTVSNISTEDMKKKLKKEAELKKPDNQPKPAAKIINESSTTKLNVALKLMVKPETPVGAPKREIQQSLENHIMIANLNALARNNATLNELMKTVASGNANSKQIAEFQKHIVKAKAMGDPTGAHARTYNSQVKQQRVDQKMVEKKVKQEEKLKIQLEKLKIRELKRELKRIEKEREKEIREAAKSERKALRQKERQSVLTKKRKDPSFKLNKTKLTALQERYVDNATLAFEFTENTAARYLLPKSCIIEKVDSNQILMSFIVIHNQQEFLDYEEDQKEYLKREAEKEAEKALAEKLLNEEIKVENEESNVETPKRHPVRRKRLRYGSTRKPSSKPQVKQEPVELPKPVRPTPVYSTVTIKLLEVPPHCHTLILNSANPVEDVQKEMQKTFEEGTRQESDYVWYQLDGITDEILAEVLRSNLASLESHNVKRLSNGRKKAMEL